MPYVEGFGTYPFGEEWLFDAVIRSYLPVLEVAERLTMTVTPVLADQLEDAGVGRSGCGASWSSGGSGRRRPTRGEVPAECRDACEAELARYRHALELLDAHGGDPLRPFQAAAAEGRIALAASAATHAVLPLLATREGLRLQLDAGIRSHRRRFGWDGGFWLPECAYAPGLEWRLAEHGVRWFCVDQSAHAEPLEALAPVATEAGPVALPIDWEAIQWLWSLDGYPSDPAHAQFAGKSLRGVRIWKVGGGAYDPAAAAAAARRQAGEFLAAVAARLRDFAAARGRRGLLVFAIDTELLGHWWSEGAIWLRRGAGRRRGGRRPAAHRPRGAGRARAGASGRSPPRPGARTRTSAPGTRPRSPTSPGGRGGWSCACCGPSRGGLRGDARRARRPRAARRPGERLGLPRQARPGRRLRLPARHLPRRGGAGGHRLPVPSPTRACAL